MTVRICPLCRRVHDPADVQRIARFDQGKAVAYLARPLDTAFPTRESAWDAICAFWQETKND